MVYLCKPSPISGESTCMTFDISQMVFDDCYVSWSEGALIQDAFPMLNADEREFLMTGMTTADWNRVWS